MRIPESELILNKDGSIYHLNLQPEDIADSVFVVGDPDRVPQVSRYFDRIEVKKQKREMVTHTGLTVMSTGMGIGGIDIALNELDALANIDFSTRQIKPSIKRLNIVRIGTCGALQKDVPVDSIVVSQRGVGFDGLAGFYEVPFNAEELRMTQHIIATFNHVPTLQACYVCDGNPELISLYAEDAIIGTTATSSGFYASQGRILRGALKIPDFLEKLEQLNLTNFEMEAAAIYALARVLGHRACVVNVVVANRIANQFSQQPTESIDKTIRFVLEKFSTQEVVA
jgi:uridine phosphorylase